MSSFIARPLAPINIDKYIDLLARFSDHPLIREWDLRFWERKANGVRVGLTIRGPGSITLRDCSVIKVHQELAVTDARTGGHRLEGFSYHYQTARPFRVDKLRSQEPHINDDQGNHLYHPGDTRINLGKMNLYVFICICLWYMPSGKYPLDHEEQCARIVRSRVA